MQGNKKPTFKIQSFVSNVQRLSISPERFVSSAKGKKKHWKVVFPCPLVFAFDIK